MNAVEGRFVRGYDLVREVGRGGMAVVYLARQEDLNRDVALKELGTFHSASRSMVERFLRESQLAASLNHPNIVTVHQFFEHDGAPYIAMEYLPRGSLRPYVGRLTFPQFVGVMEGVLSALAYAEDRGVVHRDLKPENLMVSDQGRVKITDFGIAKATVTAGLGTFMTKDGMTVGTPSYMAPEQAVASRELGPWTDLYSLGVVAYEHFVGQPPFCDDAAAVILFRHVNEAVRSPIELNPSMDTEVSRWIDRLLMKDPRKRTQSPVIAWEELEDIVVRRFGAMWRRQARLPSQTHVPPASRPLTPAPFKSEASRGSVVSPLSANAGESGYRTFGRVVPCVPALPDQGRDVDDHGAGIDSAAASGASEAASTSAGPGDSLVSAALTLCDELLVLMPDRHGRAVITEIQSELRESIRCHPDSVAVATATREALRRLESVAWTHPDLEPVRHLVEELRETRPELRFLPLPAWYERVSRGDLDLPPMRLDELRRLMTASSPAEQVGADADAGPRTLCVAAHRRALTWRAYEASAIASPMARRLASDVVRFYEEIATASEERIRD